ncbi:hypothetical protein UCREL1_9618 [Eutypa lata UCREL1]|uniref:Uncharacterized protein n=1 Tax=Eutypa lata (strain UCR-EL1) TaxID=1287681 RepID=M7SGP1_EUTLA|nr:hypothetical protein UCREL1_9618 [Eutypa lata UCREL1]
MRSSPILVLASLWPAAMAFGLTGATERATMYSIYLAEEIWTDTSQWSIAKGCKGTRKGVRGQDDRCNLAEFVDHLWESTEGVVRKADGTQFRAMDDKPDMNDAAVKRQWTAKALSIQAIDADLFKASQAIFRIKIAGTPDKTPATGYTGNIKAGNALDGYSDYYKLMEDIGGYQKRAEAEIKKIMDADDKEPDKKKKVLTNGQRKSFEHWSKQARWGPSVIYEMRIKDTAKWQLMKDGLQKFFGHEIVSGTHNYNAYTDTELSDRLKKEVKEFKEPDREATVQKWKGKFKDEAEAFAKYDEAVNDYFNSPEGQAHKAAIDSIGKSKASVGC